MNTVCGVAFLGILPFLLSVDIQPEFVFQRTEQTKGFDIYRTKLRITKFNRTTAVLNGTVDVFVDLDNALTAQIDLAYSRLGNNQFNNYPLKIAQRPFCHFLNDTYKEYRELFSNTSNFPSFGDGLCPFPAGHYWFRNFVFDAEHVPFAAPEGFWRITFLIKGRQSEAEFQIFAKFSRESYW